MSGTGAALAKAPEQIPCSVLRCRRGVPVSYEQRQKRSKEMLYRALNLRTVVGFIGSGCSVNAGMPDWQDLAREAVILGWVTLQGVIKQDDARKKDYEEQLTRFAHTLQLGQRDLLRFAFEWGKQNSKLKERDPNTAGVPGHKKRFEDLKGLAKKLKIELSDIDGEKLENALKGGRAYLLQERHTPVDISGDRLRFILGVCKRICVWSEFRRDAMRPETHGMTPTVFSNWLAERFRGNPANATKVHENLFELPIHRFITSNYDTVLESILTWKHAQTEETFKKFTQKKGFKDLRAEFLRAKAFTQKDHDSDKLARFAAGVSQDSRNMVFHCHGWHEDAKTMIVTEEDYKEQYLGERHGGAFRQTLELLVGSHPILFLGFGMNDPDLLMALRSLSAQEPHLRAQRSLFAVLPEAEAKGKDAMDRLYDQFGVHVIGFSVTDARTGGLGGFLGDLKKEWTGSRDSWLLKPKIHEAKVEATKNEYWHYELKLPLGDRQDDIPLGSLFVSNAPTSEKDASLLFAIKPKRVQEKTTLTSLVKEIQGEEGKARLIVLFGDGGSGKSRFASYLLRKLLERQNQEPNKKQMKSFFWSSYYTDDALTGIIRANKFFLGESDASLSRIDRFEKCLNTGSVRPVLVFDGIERFLHLEKNQPGIGAAINSDVRDFLACLAKLCPKQGQEVSVSNAVVVLTTRLVPKELALTGAEFYRVAGMTTEDAKKLVRKNSDPNQTFENEWAALVSLLGGHRYAMALAAFWVTDEHGQADQKKMQRLIHLLADAGPLRRVEHMIALTLRRLDGDENGDKDPGMGPHQLMMKRLAVFMGAIRRDTSFEYCYELSKREWASSKERGDVPNVCCNKDKMWENFMCSELLFELVPQAKKGQSEPEANRCVMHALVREYVFHHMHEADARKLASLTQAGFTSGASMVDPGKKGAKIVDELFLELRSKCRDYYNKERGAQQRSGKELDVCFNLARELCQDAFGVLRSRMLANTVARWGSYEAYVHYLVRMVDLTRAYCGERQKHDQQSGKPFTLFWSRCDPGLLSALSSPVIHLNGPLLGDELAWLYHELGLALYHEGAMIDCVSVWEQGLGVNKFLDGSQEGQYTFQAYCNLGAACIQWGRLPSAQEYLRLAKEISLRTDEKDHMPRLNAYLALIRHLSGDLLLANQEYKEAIAGLKSAGNARAECIFQRHWADLKLKMKDGDRAEQLIRSCRAKAEEGHFPDVVAQARLGEAHLRRVRKEYQDANREYEIALRAAKEHGMRGLESDVHCEMARLALDLGDMEIARTRAIKSLQIANELHLGLRQTHGLVVLGMATVEAGQHELGVEYLKLAKDLAAQQHYELRQREAEEELHRLGAMDTA